MKKTPNTNTQDEKMENVTNPLLDLSDEELKNTLCPYGITPDAWDFTAEELRGAIKWERLLNVSIDLSKSCNLNCPFCFTAWERAKEHKDALSFDDYKDMILKLKEAWTRTITIVGEWEPTLYGQLEDLLRFISENGMKVCLSTNWIRLSYDDKLLDLLKELNVTICLKLNSFKDEIQDPLVWKKGYTKYRNKALERLIQWWFNKWTPTRLSVNTILLEPIYEEFKDEIFKYCREKNIASISSLYIPTWRTEGGEFHWQAAMKQGVSEGLFQTLTDEQIKNIVGMIDEYDSQNGITRSPNPAYISWMSCTQILGFQIDNRGNIFSCPARKDIDENWNIIDATPSSNVKSLTANELIDLFKQSWIPWIYTWKCFFKKANESFASPR